MLFFLRLPILHMQHATETQFIHSSIILFTSTPFLEKDQKIPLKTAGLKGQERRPVNK